MRWLRTGALLAGMVLLFAACSRGLPQDTLEPAGPIARKIDALFKPVFWIATGVFVLVEGLLLVIIVKFRHRKGEDRIPKQIHGNKRLELTWTIIPTVILASIAVPTIATIFTVSREPAKADRVDITVIAHQWWWEIKYPDGNVITANEIHIPINKPVYLTLESQNANADIPVIHSFWIPRLAGKQDVVPGRVNYLTLQADTPGTYLGQCAEFCGISHAYMRARVVAQAPSDFQAWLVAQSQPAELPLDALATQGLELFKNFPGGSCLNCHSVSGLDGGARIGPDLTHLFSRTTFAGATQTLSVEKLTEWIDDPQSLKPGAKMPDYGLSSDEIRAIVAYLLTLK